MQLGGLHQKQNAAYEQVMAAIKKNKTINDADSYVPLEHQYKGLRVDEHPELLEDKEWQIATFNGDCVGINSSDIFLCTYLPDEEDIGLRGRVRLSQEFRQIYRVGDPR